MAKLGRPAHTTVVVLLFAVAAVLLATHASAGGGSAGPANTAIHDTSTLAKATAIPPVRIAVDNTPIPAGPLPEALLFGAVLVAVGVCTRTVRGNRSVRIVAAPSRDPPPVSDG